MSDAPEMKNDFSGTRQLPILAAVVTGKCGTGTVWISHQKKSHRQLFPGLYVLWVIGVVWSRDPENRTQKVWKSTDYPIEPKDDLNVRSAVAWERDMLTQIGLNERILRKILIRGTRKPTKSENWKHIP